MGDIASVIIQYTGRGLITGIYIIALIFLFLREDDRANRAVFLYLPLTILLIFLLPPVHWIYSRLDGSETYYRILWLLPMSITIGYVFVRQFRKNLIPGLALFLGLCLLFGTYTYNNENILKAENRLHIPQFVVDVCDRILVDSGGQKVMTAMPVGFVQFARQYDSRILLAYGREMLMPAYSSYEHAVYSAVNADLVNPDKLVTAIREYNCSYLVMEASKMAGVDMGNTGLLYIDTVDGYNIYRDPTEDGNLMN